MRFCLSIVLLAVTAVVGTAAPAHAQSPAEFYKGKRMTLITSASVGGGYDQYARLLAKHMPRFIPGTPTIVVQNMVGADGIRAANYLYKVAAQDGSVIGGVSRNNGLALFYDPANKQVQFDARRFHWLGSPQQEIGLFVVRTQKGAKSIDDVKRIEVTVSSTARNAPTSIYPRMLNVLYGTKIKIVEGYPGSTEVHLAMERGEVFGRCGLGWDSIKSRYKRWLDEKKISLVAQFAIDKHPELPDVPFVMDLAKTDEHKQMAALMLGPNKMGRPIFAPPGLAADRVKTLREAFAATMKDPDTQADAKKMTIELEWLDGEGEAALVKQLYSTPKPVIERVRKMMATKS